MKPLTSLAELDPAAPSRRNVRQRARSRTGPAAAAPHNALRRSSAQSCRHRPRRPAPGRAPRPRDAARSGCTCTVSRRSGSTSRGRGPTRPIDLSTHRRRSWRRPAGRENRPERNRCSSRSPGRRCRPRAASRPIAPTRTSRWNSRGAIVAISAAIHPPKPRPISEARSTPRSARSH